MSIQMIREGGPEAVAEMVRDAPSGSVVVANSVVPRDMQVVALGCLKAEIARGPKRPILYRSAGALVAARAAIPARHLLTASELARAGGGSSQGSCSGGLIVVGSYVGKSSDQLSVLLDECPWLVAVELRVAEFAAVHDEERGRAEVSRAREAARAALASGESAVLFTSREVLQDDGAGGLLIGGRVNEALCAVVAGLLEDRSGSLSFLVAKGGITSNDVAVKALKVRRAEVMGAVVPGVPAWRCGPESLAPGLAYVVFPGNVGAKEDLARVARKMSGREEPA